MTLIYLISALTIRTQHTKQERTTSGQEGQDKRPRPSVWLGQAHRASASREQPFRGTSAIVVRSSFDGASVAGAYRAHIDHAARADSRSRSAIARRAHSWSPGRARRSSRSRFARRPLAVRLVRTRHRKRGSTSQRAADGEPQASPGALKRESSPSRSRPWSAKPGDLVSAFAALMHFRRSQLKPGPETRSHFRPLYCISRRAVT